MSLDSFLLDQFSAYFQVWTVSCREGKHQQFNSGVVGTTCVLRVYPAAAFP